MDETEAILKQLRSNFEEPSETLARYSRKSQAVTDLSKQKEKSPEIPRRIQQIKEEEDVTALSGSFEDFSFNQDLEALGYTFLEDSDEYEFSETPFPNRGNSRPSSPSQDGEDDDEMEGHVTETQEDTELSKCTESQLKAQIICSVIPQSSLSLELLVLQDFLEIVLDCESRLVESVSLTCPITEADKFAAALVNLFAYVGDTHKLMKDIISREVAQTVEANTLFRGNSVASKSMSFYARRVGDPYLYQVVKPFLHHLCSSQISFEIDPLKMKEGEDRQTNYENLIQSTQQLLEIILSSVHELPLALQQLCHQLKHEVEKKFPKHSKLCVAGFFFLRFLNPSVVAPDRMIKEVSPENRRNLILISKILQNLANGIMFGEKEQFMMITNPFISNQLKFIDAFLDKISSIPATKGPPTYPKTTDEDMMNSLNFIIKHTYSNEKKILPVLQEKNSKAYSKLAPIIGKLKSDKPIQLLPVKNLSDQEKLYQDYLRRSSSEDFTDISSLGALFMSGKDAQGRPIVVFVAERVTVKHIDMEKFFLFIIKFLDPLVVQDYVLVYVHTNLDADHRPTFAWLKNAYQVFNRSYKKNMKNLYIVQPSRWLRISMACFRPFLSAKFWKKLIYVDNLSELEKYFGRTLINESLGPNSPLSKSLLSPSRSVSKFFRGKREPDQLPELN